MMWDFLGLPTFFGQTPVADSSQLRLKEDTDAPFDGFLGLKQLVTMDIPSLRKPRSHQLLFCSSHRNKGKYREYCYNFVLIISYNSTILMANI